MNERANIEYAPKASSAYVDLFEESDMFSAGKLLDTEIDIFSGDSVQSSKAVSKFDIESITDLIDKWRKFVNSSSNESDTEKAQVAVARKKMIELETIQLMFMQMTGEADNSARIEQLESEMYDHYSESTYRAALRSKIQQIEAYDIYDSATEIAKADLLDELDVLASKGSSSEVLETPEAKTIETVGDWLTSRFGEAFEYVDEIDKDKLDAHDIVSVFNKALQLEPALRKTGWEAETIERSKASVSVFPSSKQVSVPSQRTASPMKIYQLIVHECYGHALRSANAEVNGDDVGRFGTATYASFEESFEIALEQCLVKKYDATRGINHYISVGLAVSDSKSSEDISRIINATHQLKKASQPLTDESVNAARRLTGIQLKRTLTGMTDVDKGTVHRKDINYLHGLNGTWSLLNHLVETDSLDEGMKWILSAKFNPYDASDRKLVERYSPMPQSLVGFFDEASESI
jgi:hypothetical protein